MARPHMPSKRASFLPSRKVLFTLLRLPNLFTVPGDVLIGWCAGGMRGGFPIFGILASLALYSCGLLLNDLCDAKVDAKERPGRPLPAGKVSATFVRYAILLTAGLGILFAFNGWRVALLLLGLIFFYNTIAKRIPWVGVLTMGFCRGTNILLGVAVSWPPQATPLPPMAIAAVLFFTLYILLLSIVAKNEATPSARLTLVWRLLPVGLVLSLMPYWWICGTPEQLLPTLLCAGGLLCITLLPAKLPQFVGRLIRYLIPLQCLWCLIALPTMPTLIGFALLFLASTFSARHFASS